MYKYRSLKRMLELHLEADNCVKELSGEAWINPIFWRMIKIRTLLIMTLLRLWRSRRIQALKKKIFFIIQFFLLVSLLFLFHRL